MQTMTLFQTCVMAILQAIAVVIFIFIVVPLTTFAERKVIGYVQDRLGATRIAGRRNGLTGFLNRGMWRMGKVPMLSIVRGLPMFVGDIIKLLVKEDIIPDKADRAMFIVAPALSMIASVVVFAAISFYPGALFTFPGSFPILGGLPFTGFLTDMNVGLLFILGVASVGVYGIVLGAWASNSKFPLLGGLRSAAQIVSYEVPLTLSLMVPVVLAGSLNFNEMTRRGRHRDAHRAVPLLFVGFFIYFTCGFAETNRMPVRHARGGERAGGRVPHGILGHEVRLLLPGRVHQHDRGLGPGQRLLPGRPVPAALRPAKLRARHPAPHRRAQRHLVPAEDLLPAVHLHLGAGHHPPLPV